MAVRHYAHQYTVRLTDEKIIDGNVSSENSDAEDYYPLIQHSANGTTVNAGRRAREASRDETVRPFLSLFALFITLNLFLKSDKPVSLPPPPPP